VTVVRGAFLIAVGRTDTRIHIEHDGPQRAPVMNTVDPLCGETGERGEVLAAGEPLGLEPPHVAGPGHIALDGPATDDPAHRGITSQPVGIVDVFISGEPTEHRLAQRAHQIGATVPARAPFNQVLARDGHQAKRGIEFAIGQQFGIGGHAGTVELQLEATVEIEPKGIGLRFTLWLQHLRPRSNETGR
jgi:hypothetical protein